MMPLLIIQTSTNLQLQTIFINLDFYYQNTVTFLIADLYIHVFQALKATGLRTGDPRLKECMEMLKVTLKTTSDGALDRHLFKK